MKQWILDLLLSLPHRLPEWARFNLEICYKAIGTRNKHYHVLYRVPIIGLLVFRLHVRKAIRKRNEVIRQCPHLVRLKDADKKLNSIAPEKYGYDCYLVAPGASLSKLSSEEIEEIETGLTIGFNSACFVNIRYDLFFLEVSNDDLYSRGMHECLQHKIRRDQIASDSLIIKNAWFQNAHRVQAGGNSPLRDYSQAPWLLNDILLPNFEAGDATAKAVLRRWVRYDAKMYPNNMISSLITLSYLPAILGFKNIYFIGADLAHSCHIYKIASAVPNELKVYAEKLYDTNVKLHPTMQRKFNVAQALRCVLEVLQERFADLKFWAPHVGSPLCEYFPVQRRLVNYSKIDKDQLKKIAGAVRW